MTDDKQAREGSSPHDRQEDDGAAESRRSDNVIAFPRPARTRPDDPSPPSSPPPAAA